MAYTENYNIPPLGKEVMKRLKVAKQAASNIGFAIVEHKDLIGEFDQEDLDQMLNHVKNLPFEAVNNDDLIRQRCVGYANIYHLNDLLYFLYPEYDPQNGHFIQSYNLPSDVNPDFKNASGQKPRNYIALDADLVANKALHKIIHIGYQMSPLPQEFEDKPMEVEIQFIKYVPRDGQDAVSTPTIVHQDQDWAFCVFLINRENVEGGENSFVTKEHVGKELHEVPKDGVLKRYTFNHLFDGVSVDDQKIGHHVAPVSLKYGKGTGERTILILSYKPLVPSRPELYAKPSDSTVADTTSSQVPKSHESNAVQTAAFSAAGEAAMESIQPAYMYHDYWF